MKDANLVLWHIIIVRLSHLKLLLLFVSCPKDCDYVTENWNLQWFNHFLNSLLPFVNRKLFGAVPLSRFSSVSSVAQSCPTLCDPMNRSPPGLPVHHQLPEFTQIHVHWVGDAIQPSHPLSSHSPPAFNLSQHQGLFASGGQSIWNFAFSISPSNEYSGLISFRMDWVDLPAVQDSQESSPIP